MWRAAEGPAAVPVGGGGAWPGFETTHQAGAAGVEGTGGIGGPGCGARGRWRGLAGQRADAPSHTSTHQAPLVWRAPEGPEGTGGLRGAAPNKVRPPSLAGGRGLRRPEHPWGHTQQHARTNGSRAGRRPRAHQAARPTQPGPAPGTPARPQTTKPPGPTGGRADQQVSEAHRRTTTMSGFPRPLSWRTLEIPSVAATSFAVPSIRGSS